MEVKRGYLDSLRETYDNVYSLRASLCNCDVEVVNHITQALESIRCATVGFQKLYYTEDTAWGILPDYDKDEY